MSMQQSGANRAVIWLIVLAVFVVLLALASIFTGGQKISGLAPIGVTAIGNRNPDNPFDLPFRSLVKFDFPVHQPDDCPLCRDGTPVVKPGSRKQI